MRVGVIGMGVAGSSASILLKRSLKNTLSSSSVHIFDKFASPRPVGSGILLQMTGMSVLERMNALDKVLDNGCVIERLFGVTDKSWWSSSSALPNNREKVVLDLVYKEYNEHFFGLAVHRATLFQALYDQILKEQIPVHCNSNITKCIVRFDKKNQNKKEQYLVDEVSGEEYGPFDLIISATGTHSQLLKCEVENGMKTTVSEKSKNMSETSSSSARSPFILIRKVKPYEFGSLWTTCTDVDGGYFSSQKQILQKYRDAEYMAGIMPCGKLLQHSTNSNEQEQENLVSLFWSLKKKDLPQFLNENMTIDDWKEYLSHYWSKLNPLLDSITNKDQLIFAHYNDVRMKGSKCTVTPNNRDGSDECSGANILYIGDVTHGTSPQLGQGANLALIDAYILSTVLSDCNGSEQDLSFKLKQFEKLRRSHVLYYQIASAWLTPFFQSESKLAAFMRDHILGISCHIPPLQWFMSRTLSGIQTMTGTLKPLDIENVIKMRNEKLRT